MSLFKNNISFAILVTDSGWRTDLSVRFCEYYGFKFHGDTFTDFISFPDSVDDALANCKTDYLVVLQGGFIPSDISFFNELEDFSSNIFIGQIELADDYLKIDKRCIFFNLIEYKISGSPLFDSSVREGPRFKISKHGSDKKFPTQLVEDSNEQIFVTSSCSSNGAEIAIKQLQKFNVITSLNAISHYHFLDMTSPYHEIHSETIFEKQFLNTIKSTVFANDTDVISNIKCTNADIVVCPAQGLKALSLAEHVHAKSIIIYDINPTSLELQKLVFGIKSPTMFGDILDEFSAKYPSAIISKVLELERYSIIKPLKNVDVKFAHVDVFSFEIEDLIKSIDHTQSAIFDLSDIFVFPFNYYRRPLYQVRGLFAEIYSLMKSRAGASYILGFAPGYQDMDKIEVNIATQQFKVEVFENDEVELTQDMLDEAAEAEGLPPLPPEEYEQFVPVVEAAPDFKDSFSKPLQADEISSMLNVSVLNEAFALGYKKMPNDDLNVIRIVKEQEFLEFTALFEYYVNELAGVWCFKIGKLDDPRLVEFSNGIDINSFLKHLHQPVKINPKTAVKYFQ